MLKIDSMTTTNKRKEITVIDLEIWDEQNSVWTKIGEKVKIAYKYSEIDDENKVFQYDLNGTLIRGYKTLAEAQRTFTPGVSNGIINNCLCGQCRTAYGFMWLKEKFDKIEPYEKVSRAGKIYRHDLDGNFIEEYESINNAQSHFNMHERIIQNAVSRNSNRAYDSMWFKQKSNNQEVDPESDKPIYLYVNGKFCRELGSYKKIMEDFSMKPNDKTIMFALKGLIKFKGGNLSYEKNINQ